MADKVKTLARTLQAETGWSYQACRQLIEKRRVRDHGAPKRGKTRSYVESQVKQLAKQARDA